MSDSDGRQWADEIATDLVEYFIVTMPTMKSLAAVASALAELVEAEVVRILDLVVIERGRDGGVRVQELESVETMAELRNVEGEVGRLLSEKDIELASVVVPPGSTGVLLVSESRWAKQLSFAAGQAGGQIVAGERIPAARIEAILAEGGDDQGGRR